jgi:hypothetical protein
MEPEEPTGGSRRDLEAALAEREEEARTLYEVSRGLMQTLDMDRIVDVITEKAHHLLGFDSACVVAPVEGSITYLRGYNLPPSLLRPFKLQPGYVLDRHSNELVQRAFCRRVTTYRDAELRVPVGHGSLGAAVAEHRVKVTPDFLADVEHPLPEALRRSVRGRPRTHS